MKSAFTLFALLVCCISSPVLALAAEKPPLTLVAESGEKFTVGGGADKELLLLFMSFDCSACRNALPYLAEIQKKSGTKRNLVGIIFPPEEKDLPGHAKELKITFPLVRGTKELAKEFAVDKTPTLIWLDRKGQVREKFTGDTRLQQLQLCLENSGNAQCSGLIELTARPADFAGKKIITSGLLISASSKGGKAGSYYLSNGKEKIEVLPWLPKEIAPKAPGASLKKISSDTPKTMQQLHGKLITVHGQVQAGPVLKVESFTLQESSKPWQKPAARRRP